MKKLLLGLTLLALLQMGCGKDNKDDNDDNIIQPPVSTIKIFVDKTDIAMVGVPDTTRLLIFKQGEGVLSWSIKSKPSWVFLSKETGQVTSWSDTLFVSPLLEGMAEGEYNGQILFNTNADTVVAINVSLKIKEPVLSLSKVFFNFTRDFYMEKLIISNLGGNILYWQIENLPEWISVSASSGQVKSRPQEVVLTVMFNNTSYGNFDENMLVNSNAGSYDVQIALTYHRMIEVFPGEGAAKIELGYNYNFIKNIIGGFEGSSYVKYADDSFKHTLYYYSKGMEFDFMTSGPLLFGTADNIYMRFVPPYDGLTDKNIGIGSTVDDVIAAYGQPDQDNTSQKLLKYNIGIAFKYDNSKTNIVGIHIFPAVTAE